MLWIKKKKKKNKSSKKYGKIINKLRLLEELKKTYNH